MFLLPQTIERIIYTAFTPNGAVSICRLDEADFEKIPIMRQILCLSEFIRSGGGKLKLTPNGYLPLKVVKEMYLKGIIDPFYDLYPNNRMTELEARFVSMARDIACKSGILRKMNNSLHITKKGEKLLADKQQLLEMLINYFVYKFDIRYYDGYRNEEEGLGYRDAGLSVVVFNSLLKQLDGVTATGSYYANVYFSIFPWMYLSRTSENCYIFRTFQNFMEWFGMVSTKRTFDREKIRDIVTITPTELYYKMIHFAADYNYILLSNKSDLNLYKLKISLTRSNPLIWRTIQIPSSYLLSDFHDIIQDVMGWENAHLHEFEKDDVIYSDNKDEEELAEIQTIINYSGMTIADLLKEKGDRIIYRYDLGDNWLHDIELEEIIVPHVNVEYPIIIDGERKCPPEDCGGINGFLEMLNVLNDHDNPEREEYITWLGGEFNPEEFRISQFDLKWVLNEHKTP